MIKALVIGLDGATFRVLTPLMAAGYMPNLKRLLAGSAQGPLASTVPPITALAWSTFMTGNDPGRHGLLSWQGPLNERFERPWVSGQAIAGTKLWHILGQEGLRTCVYNVPVTYPPEPLNGVMVSGLLTPGIDAPFTYPEPLRETLLSVFPDYQIDIDIQHTERDIQNPTEMVRFLDEACRVTQRRGEVLRWLLEREPFDVAVAVFELPDRLQHILWRYIACLPNSLDGFPMAEVVRDRLLSGFTLLDQELGQLLALLSDDAYTILLSDHGFGPIDTMVHLNHWLAAQGWLAFDRRRAGSRELLRRAGRLFRRWLPASMMRRARASFPVLQTLDWTRTVAYAGLPSECGIFLNVQGREPAGIVAPGEYDRRREEIIAGLLAWQDPRTGASVIRAAHRREALYHGPYVERAPDIVLEFAPGYHVAYRPFRGNILEDVSHLPWGFHERAGIFAIAGPGVWSGADLREAHIRDVLPTVLYALDLPIPTGLDGRVLAEVFTPAHRRERPIRYTEALPAAPTGIQGDFTSVEADKLASRMRGLGYLE